jgi:hypothetical protein
MAVRMGNIHGLCQGYATDWQWFCPDSGRVRRSHIRQPLVYPASRTVNPSTDRQLARNGSNAPPP